jgi:hypothetical protein
VDGFFTDFPDLGKQAVEIHRPHPNVADPTLDPK